MSRSRTPSQTVGPYFGMALPWPDGPFVVPDGTTGAVWIRGVVLDGAGDPVPDALVETWQADPAGHFAPESAPAFADFRGFGRSATDELGRYGILTLVPGPVAGEGGEPAQAPHIDVSVFARGLLTRLVTRIYFPDSANHGADPVLALIDDSDRRATLIAQAVAEGYRFDIRLQGERETVFFEI